MVLDAALVIGINEYEQEHVQNLQGAVADANSIIDWLNLQNPKVDIYKLISDEVSSITTTEVLRQIDKIAGSAWGEDKKYRRLYIYYAGHGFALSYTESCFLTQEVTLDQIAFEHNTYVAGFSFEAILDFFFESVYFSEVVILNDSCRTRIDEIEITPFPRKLKSSRLKSNPSVIQNMKKYFKAYGAEDGKPAREGKQESGSYRGYFTLALEETLIENSYNKSFTSSVLEKQINSKLNGYKADFHTFKGRELSFWSNRNRTIHHFIVSVKSEYTNDIGYFTILRGDVVNNLDINVALSENPKIKLFPGIYHVRYDVSGSITNGTLQVDDATVRLDIKMAKYFKFNINDRSSF